MIVYAHRVWSEHDVNEGPTPTGIGDDRIRSSLLRVFSNKPISVVDVGANRGELLDVLSDLTVERYIGIEPGLAAFTGLEDRCRDLSTHSAINVAVSSVDGEAIFFESQSDVGSSLSRPLPGQKSDWATTVSEQVVETRRLDTICTEVGVTHVDLLKIDAQGTDLDVLRSLGGRLRPTGVTCMIVEMAYHPQYANQSQPDEILRLMRDAGYFLADDFPYPNRHGWRWYADGLFLPRDARFATEPFTTDEIEEA